MKSTDKQLLSRGFVSDVMLSTFSSFDQTQLLDLLNSPEAYERTASVKLLKNYKNEEHLKLFCRLLKTENQLYTKLALSEAIEEYGHAALPFLIPLLGKIGSNQHKVAALVDLGKNSFPLPRDIAGRIIIRIGAHALPSLENVLSAGERNQISEAIDAIGHIVFNYKCSFDVNILIKLMNDSPDDELITWKIIRCFQSFGGDPVLEILKYFIDNSSNRIFVEEAKRSLDRIIKKTAKQ